MLTLLLLRHAKAEVSGHGGDAARGLTAKGESDAHEIGAFLRAHDLDPTLAIVSTARRTSLTFALVATHLGPGVEVHEEELLYNADLGRILARLARIGSKASVVIVVGHNPGIMEAAIALAQDGDHTEIERLRGRFPPCGLAVLSFDLEDWPAACASGGRLDALVFPEDLSSE